MSVSEGDGALMPEDMELAATVPRAEPTQGQKEAIADEQRLAALTKAVGWPLFEERLRARIMHLRTLAGVDMANKSFEHIGQLTMAHQLAAQTVEDELKTILAIAQAIDEDAAHGK